MHHQNQVCGVLDSLILLSLYILLARWGAKEVSAVDMMIMQRTRRTQEMDIEIEIKIYFLLE